MKNQIKVFFFKSLHRISSASIISISLVPSLSMADSIMFQSNLERTGVYNDLGPEESPELAWKFDAASPIISTPLVYEGTVYFANFSGDIYAVDEKDGSVIWEKDLEGEPSFQITLSEDSLLVGLRFSDEGDNSYLISLDRMTGNENWRFETDYQTGLGTPAIYNETVFLTSVQDYLFSLDLMTGEELWRYPIHGRQGEIVISNDTLYSQDSSQTLHAISSELGQEKWRLTSPPTKRSAFGTPSANSCCIFTIINNDTSGSLTKINKNSGELEAEFKIEFPSLSSISLADEVAFFGDEGEGHADAHGYMNAMDIESGELLWRFETEGFVRGAASIAGDTVYFGSHDHYMYAVDRHTGEMRWRYETNAGIASTPAIVDGRLYFGSIDGHLYVLE